MHFDNIPCNYEVSYFNNEDWEMVGIDVIKMIPIVQLKSNDQYMFYLVTHSTIAPVGLILCITEVIFIMALGMSYYKIFALRPCITSS